MTKEKPILAALMLTLGISVKAGAILMLPGLMGWTQYQYGTIRLIASVILIIGF